uniref:SCAN box domain-containing protein n=1 Tax=Salarias fasciatus TaxID=181472 RepID=A0A672IJB0_SALFA
QPKRAVAAEPIDPQPDPQPDPALMMLELAEFLKRSIRQSESARMRAGETPHELYVRLRDMARRWIPPEEHTVDMVIDVVVMEQFLHMLAPEMRVWVRERDPNTASDVAHLVEIYMSARQDPGAPRNYVDAGSARPWFGMYTDVLRKDGRDQANKSLYMHSDWHKRRFAVIHVGSQVIKQLTACYTKVRLIFAMCPRPPYPCRKRGCVMLR